MLLYSFDDVMEVKLIARIQAADVTGLKGLSPTSAFNLFSITAEDWPIIETIYISQELLSELKCTKSLYNFRTLGICTTQICGMLYVHVCKDKKSQEGIKSL